MKRVLAALFGAALLVSGFGVVNAGAAPPEDRGPGPNGNNEKGLCTAYFNGQKNGHDKNGNPGPFAALEDAASEYDAENGGNDEDLEDEQQISDDVFEFCQQFGIMGQPEQNGRFDCREGEDRNGTPRDSDEDEEIECVENGTETD